MTNIVLRSTGVSKEYHMEGDGVTYPHSKDFGWSALPRLGTKTV